VFPVCTFPVLLHLTLWTAVEFLHMLLWPQAPSLSVLQLQGRGSKSWNVKRTVSFLDRSPCMISLRLVNLWQDTDTLNHLRLNLSLMDLMIEWTGLDQMLEHPTPKQVVLHLLRSLLELSLACFRALASLFTLPIHKIDDHKAMTVTKDLRKGFCSNVSHWSNLHAAGELGVLGGGHGHDCAPVNPIKVVKWDGTVIIDGVLGGSHVLFCRGLTREKVMNLIMKAFPRLF